jgi:hypothetical protein
LVTTPIHPEPLPIVSQLSANYGPSPGDVRSGNIKRVASAVGEGSIAVAFVHQAFHQ